jgi:hypothetical protein
MSGQMCMFILSTCIRPRIEENELGGMKTTGCGQRLVNQTTRYLPYYDQTKKLVI